MFPHVLRVKVKPVTVFLSLVFLLLTPILILPTGFAAANVTLTEWTLPDGNSGPWGIAVDFLSKVWFTENQTNRIGMLDPVTFNVKEWDTPSGGNPMGIFIKSAATSIRVYFTEYSGQSRVLR